MRPTIKDLTVEDYKVLTKLSQGGWFEVAPDKCRENVSIQKLFNGNLVVIESTSALRIRFKAKAELLAWLLGE